LRKRILLLIVVIIGVILITLYLFNYNNKSFKRIDSQNNSLEKSIYEDWYDVESLIDNERLKEFEKDITITGYKNSEHSCGTFLVYPIKIDGKKIHTYNEEEYMERISDVCLCSFNCLTTNDNDALISFTKDFKLLDVRNTKGSVEIKNEKDGLIIKNSKLKHGLYIVKLEIDENNTVEILFY